jgi:hypothetical protein
MCSSPRLFLKFHNNRFLSPWWRRRQVPPKRRFLQEPHGATTQKTPFFNLISYGERLLAPCPTLEDHPFQLSMASYSELKVISSIHNLRTCHAVVTSDPPNMDIYNYQPITSVEKGGKQQQWKMIVYVGNVLSSNSSSFLGLYTFLSIMF